jgi:hypothetical protein
VCEYPQLKNIDAFSAKSIEMLSALKASIFHTFFSAMKVKSFQPNFIIFFMLFFTNSETKSKLWQEMLNILSVLKFKGSHLAFYECKVSFSLISPIIFSLGSQLVLLSLEAFILNFD